MWLTVRRIADGAWADTGPGLTTRQLPRGSRRQSRCRFSAERRSVPVGKAAVRRVSANLAPNRSRSRYRSRNIRAA